MSDIVSLLEYMLQAPGKLHGVIIPTIISASHFYLAFTIEMYYIFSTSET